MAGARDFRELHCWQLANELKLAMYAFCRMPAVQRDFRYRDQILDAAASAPANIAEGFGRRTHADFSRLLDVARASLMECQNHLHDGVDRGYLTPEECAAMIRLAKRTGGAISKLQRYLRGSKDS